MDQAAKAKFILALHKHSLQAFAAGGVTGGNNTTVGPSQTYGGTLGNAQSGSGDVSGGLNSAGDSSHDVSGGVGNLIGSGPGGLSQGIAESFTTQNQFQAQNPYDPGTLSSALGRGNTVYGEQQDLAGLLQGEAAGGGPNPAQIQYEQNAGKIAQNQAQNYSSNRALNPAIAARMSGNTGANTQQQAAGGAAAQQAQQQLASQGQLSSLYGTIGDQQLKQQGLYTQAFENAQGTNAQTAQNNANAVNNTQGGLLNGIGGGLSSMLAKGGMIEPRHYDSGGDVIPNEGVPNTNNSGALPKLDIGGSGGGDDSGGGGGLGGIMSLAALLAKGGQVGEPKSHVAQFLKGKASAPSLMTKGGSVSAKAPSQKPVSKDDSIKNDKVPALLSSGEIVIPRHITMHPDAAKKAAAFVQAVLNKKRMK